MLTGAGGEQTCRMAAEWCTAAPTRCWSTTAPPLQSLLWVGSSEARETCRGDGQAGEYTRACAHAYGLGAGFRSCEMLFPATRQPAGTANAQKQDVNDAAERGRYGPQEHGLHPGQQGVGRAGHTQHRGMTHFPSALHQQQAKSSTSSSNLRDSAVAVAVHNMLPLPDPPGLAQQTG